MRCRGNCRNSSTTSTGTFATNPTTSFGGAHSSPSRSHSFTRAGTSPSRCAIHEITASGVREIRFDPDQFDYGANKVDTTGARRARATPGFRVHYPINSPQYKDEVLVFLGASYFRALGKGPALRPLGARTRGRHRARLRRGVSPLRRVLDRAPGARCAGAHDLRAARFAAHDRRLPLRAEPGRRDGTDVKARLYLRETVGKLGLAPLTSMFYFGENQPRRARGLPARGARLGRPAQSTPAPASGSGDRSRIRSGCW